MTTQNTQNPLQRHAPWTAILGILALWGGETGLGLLTIEVSYLVMGQWNALMFDPITLILDPITLTLGTAVGSVLTLSVVWTITTFRSKIAFRQALYLDKIPKKATLWCVGLSFLGAILGSIVTQYVSNGESMMAKLAETTSGLIAISIIAIIFAPITEEIYYRGFLFSSLRRGLKQLASGKNINREWITGGIAFTVIMLWFGTIHIPQLIDDPAVIPVIFVMSILWTGFRWKSDSLWPSILGHITYNSTLILISWIIKITV